MIKLVPLSRGIPMNQLMRMKSPIYTAQITYTMLNDKVSMKE